MYCPIRSPLAARRTCSPAPWLAAWIALAIGTSAAADGTYPEPVPGPDPAEIDAVVAAAMQRFSIPGAAVAVVQSGEVVFARGYGVRTINDDAPVDNGTLFAIASNTKAMTAAALAILVDDGKLTWADRVADHVPEFRLGDPYVSHEFRVRDLLIHQSGLSPGAGDLMFVPATDFTIDDIIAGLRHLPTGSGFRTEFAYSNVLYAVAGEVIHRASGLSWAEFLEQRIFRPAGMTECHATVDRVRGVNVASPHVLLDGRLVDVELDRVAAMAPAGGVMCNVDGMARWVATMLAKGRLRDERSLFSADRYAELIRPRTPLLLEKLIPTEKEVSGVKMSAYALGWLVSDRDGQLSIWHTGSIQGMVSMVALLPELDAGVVVLTNQQSGAGRFAIATHLLKTLLGKSSTDWVEYFARKEAERGTAYEKVEAEVAAALANAPPPPVALDGYVGTYRDAWRGDAVIRRQGDGLVLEFSRTDRLAGSLAHYRNGVFVVRWFDRTLDADAFLRFSVGFDGAVDGMTMRAVSDRTDFSFDFHDLNFVRLPAGDD